MQSEHDLRVIDSLQKVGLYPLISVSRLSSMLEVSSDELRALAETAGEWYQPFDFRGPKTKKWRHIDNPLPRLKKVQKLIQRRILSHIDFPEMMFGGIGGRSARDNAAVHVGQPLLVTTDLKDCFPNINHKKVNSAWHRALDCSKDIGSLLTRLTTYHRRLPLGAPTSPLLACLTLIPMYADVERLAQDLDLKFSFFVDDIAVSGARAAEAMYTLKEIVARYGHAISWSKNKSMASSESQVITGVTVNHKVSNGPGRIHAIRGEILDASHGIVTTDKYSRLMGKIGQATYIDKAQGNALRRLASRMLLDVDKEHRSIPAKIKEVRQCNSFARHRQQ